MVGLWRKTFFWFPGSGVRTQRDNYFDWIDPAGTKSPLPLCCCGQAPHGRKRGDTPRLLFFFGNACSKQSVGHITGQKAWAGSSHNNASAQTPHLSFLRPTFYRPACTVCPACPYGEQCAVHILIHELLIEWAWYRGQTQVWVRTDAQGGQGRLANGCHTLTFCGMCCQIGCGMCPERAAKYSVKVMKSAIKCIVSMTSHLQCVK